MRDIFSLLFFAADSAFCFVFLFCLWLWFSPFVSLLFLFCFRSYCFVLFINVVLLKMCVLVVYAWILLAPVTLQFVCFILFLRFCYVFFFLLESALFFCKIYCFANTFTIIESDAYERVVCLFVCLCWWETVWIIWLKHIWWNVIFVRLQTNMILWMFSSWLFFVDYLYAVVDFMTK